MHATSCLVKKRKCLLAILIVFVVLFTYHEQHKVKVAHFYPSLITRNVEEYGVPDPEVECKFPYLHPFDPATAGYINEAPDLRCLYKSHHLLTIDNEGFLIYNETGWSSINITPGSVFVNCWFKEIGRQKTVDGQNEFIYSDTITYKGKIRPNTDFVYVQCDNILGIAIYMDYFAFAQKREPVREYKDDNEYDIIVIGLDSMSRLNFIRQLPKTYQYMKNTLNSIEMFGFHKVGLNTFPNVMAMLTGRPPPPPPHNHFENYVFMWDYFKKIGASTMYAEDMPVYNMFILHGKGIQRQPTDHYAYYFWQAIDKSTFHSLSNYLCLGSRPKHSIHFKYLKSFLWNYKNSPKFLFSLHNEITHDYLNLAGILDDDVKDLLESSYNEGLFNRSIVILLGDHGQRIDKFRHTEMGKIEDFMPLVSFILPQNSDPKLELWRSSLMTNSHRLTSSYDLFKTFLDVLIDAEYEISNRSDIAALKMLKLGSSLFKPVLTNRTCFTTGIIENYCTCSDSYNTTNLDENSMQVKNAANLVIKDLNEKIFAKTDLCIPMTLSKVTKSIYTESSGIDRMYLTFIVSPSDGLIESIVQLYKNGTHKVIGDGIRINVYLGQSDCLPDNLIADEMLKTLCYCKSGRSTKIVVTPFV